MGEITVYGADWCPVVVFWDGVILVEPSDPELLAALERAASP